MQSLFSDEFPRSTANRTDSKWLGDGLVDVFHLTFLSLTLCITIVKSTVENGLSN